MAEGRSLHEHVLTKLHRTTTEQQLLMELAADMNDTGIFSI